MLVSLVERGCQGCGRARPFWACQEKHSCIHPSARKVHSANFALTEFSEVPAVFVLWGTYTPLKQEYAAFVAWLRDRRVKAQDSYLPSS
jgi:hypothetical protein